MTELDVKKMPKKIKSVRSWTKWTAYWIRKNGHYQLPTFRSRPWSKNNPSGPCCLVLNPAYVTTSKSEGDTSLYSQFEIILNNSGIKKQYLSLTALLGGRTRYLLKRFLRFSMRWLRVS